MNKIKEISHVFKNLFTLIFWGFPFALIVVWFQDQNSFIAHLGVNVLGSLPSNIIQHLTHSLSLSDKTHGFLLTCIPLTIFMAIAFLLRKLFSGFEQGSIFTLESIRCIRALGTIMFIWAALNPIYQSLLDYVITLNTHKKGVFDFSIGADYFINLITAGIIFLIAYIMQEGVKLSEEQTLTV